MPSAEVVLGLMDAVGPPPLHPGCRCSLATDGEWVDAGDARVCPRCALAGATWNLHLDIPLPFSEVRHLLDPVNLDDYRRALRRDAALADAVVQDSAKFFTGGLVVEVGLPTRNSLEAAAVRATAEQRVVTEPRGEKRAYRFISVLLAENAAGRVVRRNGKYLVVANGKTLFAEDDLALALLLLAMLLRRRDEKSRRESQEASNG